MSEQAFFAFAVGLALVGLLAILAYISSNVRNLFRLIRKWRTHGRLSGRDVARFIGQAVALLMVLAVLASFALLRVLP